MEFVKGGGDMIIAFDGRKYDTLQVNFEPAVSERESSWKDQRKESCNSQGVM